MNRAQRRAAEAKARADRQRADTIALALNFLATAGPTATGATLMLPDGETLYLDAAAVRSTASTGKPQ